MEEQEIEATLRRVAAEERGRVSMPGDPRYASATAIWPKPVGALPRVIVHCRTAKDVQMAIRTAGECQLPLSVRGGGHDWAGRALCEGLVIDLREMNGVAVSSDHRIARVLGGARASDVATVTDPLGLVPVTGTVGAVGMAGLTLGGGYGPLIGRFGLALDNLVAAEVVLADGRIVTASEDEESELFWALRGGGGNFGVVTAIHLRVHDLPSVRTGVLVYPFSEAPTIIARCAELSASASDALTVQVVLACGPDGAPIVLIVPTWCGSPEEGKARLAPFRDLGTLLTGGLESMRYGRSLTLFDAFLTQGQRTFMQTCSIPALDDASIEAIVESMKAAASPGCAIITHEFRGAASRVPAEATAFGHRDNHLVLEFLASFIDRSDPLEEERHRSWGREALRKLEAIALPGAYPNFLVSADADRVKRSYGPNAARLLRIKRRYDPDNVFRSAIPLPDGVPGVDVPEPAQGSNHG